MHKYDAIIIGSGLGGLLCGYTLSKEGMDVCIVEKNDRLGGCIQSFVRDGVVFNTGFNYTESLGPGEVLNRYFTYYGLMDALDFRQMDVDGFERISFMDEETEYPFAQGYDHFIETMARYFPAEREALGKYISGLSEVVNKFPLYNLEKNAPQWDLEENMSIGLSDFLNSITQNKRLQHVLCGTKSLYGAVEDRTPLYIHALINYSFIKSAWRLVDGGSKLATKMAMSIKANGGTILRNKPVAALHFHSKDSASAEFADGDVLRAKNVISSLHPAPTLNLVKTGGMRKIFKSRIQNLENTVGMFTVYIVLKKHTFKYQNYNHHHYTNNTVWTADYKNWPEHYMMYTQVTSKTTDYANGVTILTYMKYSEVEKWAHTTVEQRGEEYEEFKRNRAERLIDCVAKRFPELKGCIQSYYASTPLTYRDYTGTEKGSSYGILKDYRNPLQSLLLPRSPIHNLLFTGQNLNMHGILGVTVGAVSTCGELIGEEYLLDKIRNA